MPSKTEIKNIYIPVFVTDDDGNPRFAVGKASLKAGTLVVEFDKSIASTAVQRMFAREELMGLAVIKVSASPETEAPDANSEVQTDGLSSEDTIDSTV